MGFTMVAIRDDKPLGGHNIQVRLRAPDGPPLDEDAALRLTSGWLVNFRNEFAKSPDVATEIIESADDALSQLTAELTAARGPRTEELTRELFETTFHAKGRNCWR